MARRKNKKQSGEGSRQGAGISQQPRIEGAPKNAPAQAKAAGAGKRPERSGMRRSTWAACMFLAFILGVYLGTLMPGVMADINAARQETRPQAAAEKTPSSASAPAPAAEPAAPRESARPQPQIPAAMATRIAELESIVSKKAENVAALIELGNLYFDTSQPKKAIAAYGQALAISPNNADVLTDMGIMYREDGDYARALDCFRKAVAINPAHENAMYNEGVVLLHDMGKKEEAAAAWKRLLGVNPDARAPDGRMVRDMLK